MSLENGLRLGPYEISGLLGQGGMGEVYRARDTRLDRTVALKTLHPELSAEPQFRERFVREARAISALNHPHICALYDVGQTGDLSYLVMEHISGSSLAERIRNGPMPVQEALECAAEVADALDHAHRHGIVHRDLKPSNIVLTKNGAKLLDFGIAKILRPSGESPAGAAKDAALTMTTQGVVVGTLHYMAPEQLHGQEVDGRADLFALGAVLYEMIIGARAFDGGSQATIMAKIVSGEPERLADLSVVGPPELERLIRRCLAKDPDDRWQTARDLRAELRWVADRLAHPSPAGGTGALKIVAPEPPRKRPLAPWLIAAASLAAAAVAVPWAMRPHRDSAVTAGSPMQFAIAAPPGETLALDEEAGGSAISPDGTHLAVAASRNGRPMLLVRPMRSLEMRILEGTEGAAYPFWSPDSRWIGFFAGEKLKRIALSGGAPQTLAEAIEARGGTWGAGMIVYAPAHTGPLYRVPESGGDPTPLTKIDPSRKEEGHGWPHFLPGGKTVLFLVRHAAPVANHIRAVNVDGTPAAEKIAATNYRAVYDETAGPESGRLLFIRDSTLFAQPFHPVTMTISGEPKAVAFNVAGMVESGYAGFCAAGGGVLVHRVGDGKGRKLRWLGRDGKVLEEFAEPDNYVTLRLSPKSGSVVVTRADSQTGLIDLWIIDPARKLRTRLTFDDGIDTSPVWSPEESEIAFASSPGGVMDLFRKRLDGGTAPARVMKAERPRRPTDWSLDGTWIVYEETHPQTRRDLWMMPAGAPGDPVALAQTPFNEYQGQLSPDARWLAYTSDDTGRPEVYLRGVQERGAPLRVSTDGGFQPRWKRDGKELYYLSLDGKLTLSRIAVDARGKLDAGTPVPLFDLASPGPAASDYRYDVSADAQRFLVIGPADDPGRQHLTVTVNWRALLE